MIKKMIFYLLFAIISCQQLNAYQCQNDSTGLIPITDMIFEFNAMTGGLYGNWENSIPDYHLKAGIEIANTIEPLDEYGYYNTDGKIGFISIGMSNCNQFFATFINKTNEYENLNKNLMLLNCAVGAKDIDNFLNENDSVWVIIDRRLKQSNLSYNQVQVIWFLQAKHITGIPANEGIEHIDIMYHKFLKHFVYLKNIPEFETNF